MSVDKLVSAVDGESHDVEGICRHGRISIGA